MTNFKVRPKSFSQVVPKYYNHLTIPHYSFHRTISVQFIFVQPISLLLSNCVQLHYCIAIQANKHQFYNRTEKAYNKIHKRSDVKKNTKFKKKKIFKTSEKPSTSFIEQGVCPRQLDSFFFFS